MVQSEDIQEVANLAVIQTETMVMVVLKGADVGHHLAPTAKLGEPQWQMQP